jgi:hypothetical protein
MCYRVLISCPHRKLSHRTSGTRYTSSCATTAVYSVVCRSLPNASATPAIALRLKRLARVSSMLGFPGCVLCRTLQEIRHQPLAKPCGN